MKLGDGTGMGSMPPEEKGLSHVSGDEPEKPSGTLKTGETKHASHEGPQRTTHAHGDKKVG